MEAGCVLGEKEFVFIGNTLVGYGENGICDIGASDVEIDGIVFTVN